MKINADFLGISSSTLCLIHCLVVPFVWVGRNVYEHSLETASLGWGFEIWDYAFGLIALWAVYHTFMHTHSRLIKVSLVIAYVTFLVGLLLHEPHEIMYTGSFLLVLTHSYNLYLCKKGCATTPEKC